MSPAFHKLLLNMRFSDPNLVEFSGKLIGVNQLASKNFSASSNTRFIPDLVSFAFINVTQELGSITKLMGHFRTDGIRAVLVAARTEVDPWVDLGKSISQETKLYTETYFTDSETAEHLSGVSSLVGAHVAQSFLNKHTGVVINARPAHALRASIADPL